MVIILLLRLPGIVVYTRLSSILSSPLAPAELIVVAA